MVLSGKADAKLMQLEKFLLENIYLSAEIGKTAGKVRSWLEKLFGMYCDKPDLMPSFYQQLVSSDSLERSVCDYISGMTDRYCLSMLDES